MWLFQRKIRIHGFKPSATSLGKTQLKHSASGDSFSSRLHNSNVLKAEKYTSFLLTGQEPRLEPALPYFASYRPPSVFGTQPQPPASAQRDSALKITFFLVSPTGLSVPERLQQKKGAPEWLFLGRPRQALQLREQLREGAAAQTPAPQPSCFEGRGRAEAVAQRVQWAGLRQSASREAPGSGRGEPNPILTLESQAGPLRRLCVVPKPLTEQLFHSSKLPEKVSGRRLRQPLSAQAPLSAAAPGPGAVSASPCRPLPSPAPCKPRPAPGARARAEGRVGKDSRRDPEARLARPPPPWPPVHPVRPAQP